MGYPVLTLAEDGSTSQSRFLAMLAEKTTTTTTTEGDKGGDTSWSIPVKVVWEGGWELVVMLEGGGRRGDGDRQLMKKVQQLQAAGLWFKVRGIYFCCFFVELVVILEGAGTGFVVDVDDKYYFEVIISQAKKNRSLTCGFIENATSNVVRQTSTYMNVGPPYQALL